jgi:ABC-type sugar transport system permease subunit
MYYNAFIRREAGYACAMGVVLFCIIFMFTYLNVRMMGRMNRI